MKNYNRIAGQRTQRIEALSDGVFAIAMTLLILDIKVPVGELINSEATLVNAFIGLAPKLLSYFLSFITLGIYWVAQLTQFHFINKSDRHLSWINLFFLLCVSAIPFSTAFLSAYINFKFAVGIYWINLFMLGTILAFNWLYAIKHNFLTLEEKEKKETTKAIKRRIIEAQSLYTMGALLCFIPTSVLFF